MSRIKHISINNFRGIRHLSQDFDDERFIVLIGRGNSGKSTLLTAINYVLSPSWNVAFSDLDFYNQNTATPIEIEVTISELPDELLKESKYGLYLGNSLDDEILETEIYITIKLTVDSSLEPHWVVKARPNVDVEDKSISANDRALLAVNYIADFTDNQFAFNRQSPLYALTKSSLEKGQTIELVKSKLLRSISENADNEDISPLKLTLPEMKKTAESLGLTLGEIDIKVDIKENPYTGNSIALHDDNLPFRVQGKGNKRLMSIAIQSELTKQGGIVLIDELEQGLEPDRIVTLVQLLKKTKSGQVFITTHSVNVVIEAAWQNLFILHNEMGRLSNIGKELEECHRAQPHIFFAKKIVCCEGKTEVGFIRPWDAKIRKECQMSFSSAGVVLLDTKGGDKMYTSAMKLKALGYDVCVFADDDKPEELSKQKAAALDNGIALFLCGTGNCLESQLLADLPWNVVKKIAKCPQEGFHARKKNIEVDMLAKLDNELSPNDEASFRKDISAIISKGEWFKDIPGGEFLGEIVMDAFDELDATSITKQNLTALFNWCGFQYANN